MATTKYLPELSTSEMLELLDGERVGRLGLNDDPQPYVVPTDFVYSDGIIYIHSPKDGKKSELARKNGHVCFEVDKYNESVTEYRSVIVRGDIAEIFDEAGRRNAMRILARKAARSMGWHAHVGNARPGLTSISIFKIDVKEMTGVRSPNGGHP